ncbi:hypothetical protein FOZ62_015498 [Perkinsus olseni]|uniref:Uncharacterized protein n=1 Tax=Perkinsus olseni TaxID=32597 RepID=A0A7J6Q0V2_PEROL|nr:hypothetical protein FOZ62_015498 [Perkinsus olseni]
MFHFIVLSAAALVIGSLAQDEHAWLVRRFDDSFEDMNDGAMDEIANNSGLPGPYERPTGTCGLSLYDEVIGCYCDTKGLLGVACAPPCDYRRVLGHAGGLRVLKGPPMLSCATPSPYGTLCWDGRCLITPEVIRGDASNGNDCPSGMQPYSIEGTTTRVCMYPI